jgi:hypothetical protein
MATLSIRTTEIAHTRSGGAPYTRSYPEAASQSFKRGQFVNLTGTAGKVTAVADDATTNIQGIALHDASGVTDTPVLVAEANDDTIFVASGIGAATAVNQVGTTYALDVTSNKCTVDLADSTGGILTVVGIDSRDTLGDTNGRVLFVVAPAGRGLAKS